MLHFLLAHPFLAGLLAGPPGLLLALAITWVALRTPDRGDTARHRSRRTAIRLRSREPRHALRYAPQYEHAAYEPAHLGVTADGELTLLHATPAAPPARIADEPTVPHQQALLRRHLIGASA